jgi:hypothetical protein
MKAQFEVDEVVWGRIKVASMLACKSIGEMIGPVLSGAFPADMRKAKIVLASVPVRGAEDVVSGHLETTSRTGGSTPPTGAKTPPVAVSAPPNADHVGVPDSTVEHKRCVSCKLMCTEWVYDRKGLPICNECAERLSGGNP